MSVEIVSIVVLAVIFLIATVRPVNLGALAIVAAFVLGVTALPGADPDERTDAVLDGFPGELFVILVGVTYLFAIATANGTVDWLVQAAIRAVRGRVGLIPWIMFLVTAALTAMGAVVPASVAIIAPIGMGFAVRYRINPLMMGLLIINGASAGGFSPISIFGGITNGVVEKAGLPGDPMLLFAASFVVNLAISVVAYFVWGGRELLGRRDDGAAERTPEEEEGAEPEGTGAEPEEAAGLDRDRILTLVGLVALAVTALFFDLNVGLVAITVAVVLTLLAPEAAKGAVGHVAWPTVLLVCGIVLYVGVMQTLGTIDWLGEEVATVGAPLVAALVICFIGASVSAFASTTGILGALIPLAVPFLTGTNAVGAVGLITALALSSSIVDSSPFSTSGALTVANTPEDRREYVYRGLMRWGFGMVVIIPIVTWLILVVPGRL
ncbi:SLC13 family permease [Actinoplanes rectilineatus]|uniref:SLC13 family permease n=1 Tax=Actinoplanes rectilineatus TaxID=113571 RepID=UPI0005F27CF9|nr:SLC13 family permease [Actinoplanes rectilineatus]